MIIYQVLLGGAGAMIVVLAVAFGRAMAGWNRALARWDEALSRCRRAESALMEYRYDRTMGGGEGGTR